MKKVKKFYKGEKYIYLLMAIKGCQQNEKKTFKVGDDNGMIGGQNYERCFSLTKYDDKELLIEHKSSKSSVVYSRTFEVWNIDDKKPTIMDYIENDFNCGQNWSD